MAPNAPMSVDLDALKSALSTLQGLQDQLGSDGMSGAYSTLQGAQDISPDLGPLLNQNGPQIASYYQQHAMKIQQAISRAGVGVGAAVNMLQASIRQIERNEKQHQDGANRTDTGGASATPRTAG
jgi:uncharacterized protein YoaH (UPF0181 family)